MNNTGTQSLRGWLRFVPYHSTQRRYLSRRTVEVLGVPALAIVAFVGCHTPAPSLQQPGLPTQSDRLMKYYPELRSGRFAVIADFEDLVQLELFQLRSGTREIMGPPVTERGHAETGRSCLTVSFQNPGDELVVSNDRAANWFFKRDWRGYDLLLLSIWTPTPGRTGPSEPLWADITVQAGPKSEPLAVHSAERLKPGWNTLRFDLVELVERLPLDDIREVRLRVLGTPDSISVKLDDMILTSNREDLLGDSANSMGGFYVQRAGRGWNIGAGGQFELGFSNGQVSRWYNLRADPLRVHNLVRGSTLGPSVLEGEVRSTRTILSGEASDQVPNSSTGAAIHVEIVELNSVRTIVRTELRVSDGKRAPDSGHWSHRWDYTIYPTGQVYVSVTGRESRNSLNEAPTKLAIPGTVGAADSMKIVEASAGAMKVLYGVRDCVQGDALLLFVPLEAVALNETPGSPDDPNGPTLVASYDGEAGKPRMTHLFLGSTPNITEEELRARAWAYAHPPPLKMELGHEQPFDHAAGCYVIAPNEGRVRFQMGGKTQSLFTPAFRFQSPDKTLEAWVYVNDRLLTRTAFDSNGDLIVQVPDLVSEVTVVEVLFRLL